MERYIKANRKVVELLQLTEDRTELQDGNFILWCQDILQLGEPIEFEETLSRIGAIAMARPPAWSRKAKCATSCL